MKVLFWLNIGFDKHSTSGHLLSAVIEQTMNLGHEVHVIQKDTGGDEPHLPKSLSDRGVTQISIKFYAPEKSHFAKRYIAEIQYIKQSSKYINNEYDAIFIQSNIAAGFSVKAAKKRCSKAIVTYNVQDVYPQDVFFAGRIGKRNPAYIAMLAVQKYAYKNSDHIITISEDMKELIIEAGAPYKKVEVIYNWSYQDSLFEKKDISPTISSLFDETKFNIVYAGNIGLFQNVDIVIEVAKEFRNNNEFWFHIFGSGLYKEKLENKVKELGIQNITFHPIQPHELASSIYASASVNLIPLGRNQYQTALPSKTATCLACQSPIIFIIGTESIFGKNVSAETGCPVLDCDDVNGIVDAIEKIKSNKISINTSEFYLKRCSITKNSRAYAEIITKN